MPPLTTFDGRTFLPEDMAAMLILSFGNPNPEIASGNDVKDSDFCHRLGILNLPFDAPQLP